jgi:hypothetical protein
MALTVPEIAELALFMNVASVEDPRGYMALQQATVLMGTTLGLTEDYTGDPDGVQLIKWGILDMAWKLLVSYDNREELYTPYTSERVGSYSYSKMQAAASKGEETGVPFFDQAIAYMTAVLNGGTVGSISSENVMHPDWATEAQIEAREKWSISAQYSMTEWTVI